MASSARLVTIKRSGEDGAHFPLSLSSCLFGRSIECDIRIQLPVVSKNHCKIEVKEKEAILYNFSSTNPTQVNGATIDEPVQLRHGDIITIIDRSFRYEDGSREDESRSAEFPGKSLGKEPPRRASRDSSCADPDGKGQDTKASRMTASRRSFVHAKGLSAVSPASDGSKDSVTQDSAGHVEEHSRKNTGEHTSGDLFKTSRATGRSYRELKSSAQSLSNINKNESPFEKLYQSMKEELDVKSQKSCRKSEPQSDHAAEESCETQLSVSRKARPKSSGSIPVTATPSPKVGKILTATQSGGMGPVQTSTETAKMKTPVRKSQQLKDEDSSVTGRRNSVNQDESECAQAVHKIVTPGKLVTRNQTVVKVRDVANPANTPENSSSKKRRSMPTKVEVPSAETQKRLSLTQCIAPAEKKSPKDSFSKPEKLATAAEQTCSEIHGLSSVDISNFSDSINKSEAVPLKRRRVSFGGHLRPELFDENLPPNTPLKRGETPTKRKSLGIHSPAVLKKIIKEQPQSPGKQESLGITPPRTNDQKQRSGRTSLASSGNKFFSETDVPKKAGRKSGNLPAKRASISRSQHGILQMICSKRRSGASEANLIVAKSWADVVKLGVKQTQMKVVKQVPQKQTSKRQRRPSTPKKPTSSLHNQFTTGHANSPCTIVIGRAQMEKVSMPARPYRMLNNLMLNQKVDFSEDLSGLTEMFKTPVKDRQQQTTDMGSILSKSEDLSEGQLQVTNSGDTPLPITSEILEEKMLSSTQSAGKQQSDRYSASPTLRRRSIKHENTMETPKNVYNITHLEKKTLDSETEPLKTASSMSKLRRSRELRHTLVENLNEETEAVLTDSITGRHLRKISQGKEVDQEVQDSENSSQRCKENGELNEGSEKTSTRRSSIRKQKPTKDLGSQIVIQTANCSEELLSQEQGTIQNLEESMHMQNTSTKIKVQCKSPQPTTENIKTSIKSLTSTSGSKVEMKEELSALTKFTHMSGETRHTLKVLGLEHGDIKTLKQSENEMLATIVTGHNRPLEIAKKKAQPLEDLADFKELFLSPVPGDKIAKMPSKSPLTEPGRTRTSTVRVSKTKLSKEDVREVSSTLGKRTKSPGRAARTPGPVQKADDTPTFIETPKQKLDFTGNSTGHKRKSQTPNRTQPLKDQDGFQKLFQTPAGVSDSVTVEESAEMSLESSQQQPVRTPASTKRVSKTGLSKVDVREVSSTLGKRTKSPGRAASAPGLGHEEDDTMAFMETPKQKLDFTGNSVGSSRRSRTSKNRSQSLENLDGFQELFQTPAGVSDSVTVEESAKMSLESSQQQPVRTPASTKRVSKTGLSKEDVREVPSTLGKQTKSPGRAASSPAPVQEEDDIESSMETPKQKLDFIGNSTGHKRSSRTPKSRAQPVEDQDGIQELFQTPAGVSDSVTVKESAEMSLESSQQQPVRTPASTKRVSKTGLSKEDVREVRSTLGKGKKSPGRAASAPGLGHEEDDTTAFMETPKQKLDFTGNSVGSSRRSRTSKNRSQSLENLDGFQELFQTPAGVSDSVTVEESAKMSLESSQQQPVRTPASTKRVSKTGLSKEDVREVPSTLGKRTKSPGRAASSPAPVQEEDDIESSMETPKQKLDFIGNSTGHKRRSQTPKNRAQPLEDQDGIQELFQTPAGISDSVTVEESVEMSLESSQQQPVTTPASTKRVSKTGLSKDVREVPSTLGKQTKSPGRAASTQALVHAEDDTMAFMETPKQKLDFTGNSAGSSRRSRTSKNRSQSLENLDGFQELFQTPAGVSDSVTVEESAKMSLESSQQQPVRTPASTKRVSKTGLSKEDVREVSSTLGKRTKSPGRAASSPAPVQEEDDIESSMETPKQKLDFIGNSTGHKRRIQTPKNRAQPLEDQDGIQELFQTPAGISDSVTVEESVEMSLESSQQQPVTTPASTKRVSKTGLSKDVREVSLTLRKRTKSPGRAASLPAPVQEEDDIECSMETPKQKLELAWHLLGSRRRSQTPKNRTQPLEDLDGFQELFQTPAGVSDSVTVEESAKMSLESSQQQPVRTPASRKRVSKTGLSKDVREVPSTLGKRTKSPGRAASSPALVHEENDTTAFMETPKQKLELAGSLVGSRRSSWTSKNRSQPLEDLDGFQELFQTPAGVSDSVTVEESAKMSLKSSQQQPVRTPASRKRVSKTGLSKVDVREVPSTPGKETKSPGRAARAPALVHEDDTIAFMETPKQKLESTGELTGLWKQSRTPKAKAQCLEDITSFQELFQTPEHSDSPLAVGKTKNISFNSSQPKSVIIPKSIERQSRASMSKMDVKEEFLEEHLQLEEGIDTLQVPNNNNKVIRSSRKATKRKLDPTARLPGSKRMRRSSKDNTPFLEDRSGFQQLFQMPVYAKDSLNIETSTMLTKSPQSGLVGTQIHRKSMPKICLRKVDMTEELSILWNQSPGTAPTAPVQENNGIKSTMETPKGSLQTAVNVTGLTRQPQTPKEKVQPLEDYGGFQELFQTPPFSSDPLIGTKRKRMSLKSQSGHIKTPASTKTLSNTSLMKVDELELSIHEKQTQSPGRAARTPAPMQEDDTMAIMETPKQKVDFVENSTGHKRRSQTPKNRAQPLEDLDGFQELFQTPADVSDSVTVEESAKMSLESSQQQPVRTPASTKRVSKTGLSKEDVREVPSTLGKRTKSPGRAASSPAPVQEEDDIESSMETPKQKLDFIGNSTGHKRRSQTPKNRAQPLEDLDGFQELFQTPAGVSDSVTVEESAEMSLESSQQPVRTPASTKRVSKTGLSKVNKPMYVSQKVVHTPKLSEDHGKGTKDVKISSAPILDPAVHVTRGKREQGLCKKRSESPEDLFGFQELFQISGHKKDPVTLDNLPKMPSRSPPPEPIDTLITSRRHPRTRMRKVNVKNELSEDRMHSQMSEEIVDLSRVPEGEDKVIKTRKQSVKRKLDTAVNVPGSKRPRIAGTENPQTLEHLPIFQELCQAPSLVMDSETVEKTTKMPGKSPEPVDTTSETQPRRRPRRLGVTEEPKPQRKTTRVLRQTRNTHKEPVGVDEFKGSSTQKQDPVISLAVRRNQPRTVKKTQPLEELASFQEETATRMSCKSPQPEEKTTVADLRKQLRIQLFKVGVKEEPTAQRKQPARETRNTLKEPVGDSINVEELKKSTKRKIDPEVSVPVSKRPQRVPKAKAQTLELAGLKGPIQTLGHTEESASDKGPTQVPCNSLQPEQVDSPQMSSRRSRTRHGKVKADEEPSAVRKTVPTSRQTMRSHKVRENDENSTQPSKVPVKQTLDTVAEVAGSRRQLRTRKDGVQPLEVLGDSKEITQISDHSEKLRHGTNILKSTLQQKPDSAKPLRTCRRVLRASNEDPKEVLVDTSNLAALQSKSNSFQSPQKSARDRSILKTRASRSVTPKQEATDEKPVHKKQRAAPTKRHVSPEPVKMKHPRIMSNKLGSVEEQISTIKKTEEMEAKKENPVAPDQKTPQSSRNQKKTNEKQPRSKFDISAEKVAIKKNEKTMRTSQETELQNTDNRAKKSSSRGKVSGERTCLRSRKQTEIPKPCEAEEKTNKSGAERLIKTQKEKGISGDSDVRCLRSRKTRVTLDSEPKPRVIRGATKDTKTSKKDEDIVYTKKLRTRSQK